MRESLAEYVHRHGPALPEIQPHRLPIQPGPLFGRDWEVQAVRLTLLQTDVRLLTLWGPAGIGKTRLALAVAADPQLAAEFDAIVFVDLAPVAKPTEVIPAILEGLGIEPRPAPHGVADIIWSLHNRRVLLLLDNLEHVVDVAPELAPLLVNCPALKILATSRAALRLRWEHAFPVAPLAVPRPPYPSDAATVASYAGVALFTARASAVRRDFQLTDANAQIVAELCARLDGLPLALELAASRIKGLPLLVLLARLDEDRLQLLQAGAPDLPVRQQTLRRALAWSYDLLDKEQQALFRRLSVFVDGWTLEAAEGVCGLPGLDEDVMETLAALVDASLVCLEEPPGGPPRYLMLATVRDYALGLLRDSGEAFEVGRRHAAFYLASAEQPEREHANLQAAMQWAMQAEPSLLDGRVAQQLQVYVSQERPAGAIECPQMVLVNGCLEEFTPREREVIDLAVRGWSNRQIANQLVISERTAEGHIHNILGKLQLESRSQLAAWGVRAGLVPTEGPLPTAAALRG